jgi:ABC-type amino acid transport substrate-binding protein
MRSLPRLSLILAAALSLAACATAQRLSAAHDVHALLVSIRDDDSAAFEAHVDRKALKREIEARLVDRTRSLKGDEGWKALGVILAPALADIAGDNLVQPKVFRSVAAYYGYKPSTPIPGAVAIAGALKTLPDGRVCATQKKDGPCLLVFTQSEGVWKLSGFEGDISMLRVKP